MKRCSFLALLFLLPVLILLPNLSDFVFLPGNPYSDMAISHYPNALYLQNTIREWKTIPLWSPLILSGYPFMANPLSGLWYPPGWLALIFPLPLGFNLLVVVHLILAGVGMFLLLRSEGLAEGAALLGALAFAALPKLFSHLGAGHLTLIYAVCWTPWLLYVERRAFSVRQVRWILPGLVLGLITLADVRWAAYAGLLWITYSLRIALSPGDEQEGASPVSSLRMAGWAARRASNLVFAFLAAAPLLMPLLEYTRLSTRSQLTAQESFILSLPPGQLLGLVYPTIGAAAEWTLYPGAVIFLLALLALSMPVVRRKAGFWFLWIALTLVFALGSHIPFLDLLARLPGADLLRVPPRVLFLNGFCFTVVAAYALQGLYWVITERAWAPPDRSSLVVFAVTTFVVLLAAAVVIVVDQPLARLRFAWGGAFFLVGSIIILLGRGKRISTGALTVLAIAFCMVDLIGVNRLSIVFHPVAEVLSPGQDLVAYIQAANIREPFRVYSPSYSIPQHVAAQSALEMADGIDPLQLARYARFMEGATGVPSTGYSVTLPPFAGGDPALDNQAYMPNAEMLGLLNIRFVLSEFELPGSRLTLLARFGQQRVYENPFFLPRAWVQEPDGPIGQKILSVPWIYTMPNSIIVRAKGPGLLVLSELAYPGWVAFMDGQPARLETVGSIFRGLRLEPGDHTIEVVFRPASLYSGLALSLVAWLGLFITLVFWSVRRD